MTFQSTVYKLKSLQGCVSELTEQSVSIENRLRKTQRDNPKYPHKTRKTSREGKRKEEKREE